MNDVAAIMTYLNSNLDTPLNKLIEKISSEGSVSELDLDKIESYSGEETISKTDCCGIAYVYGIINSLSIDDTIVDINVFIIDTSVNGDCVYRIPFNSSLNLGIGSSTNCVVRYKERS